MPKWMKVQWVDGVRYWHALWSMRMSILAVVFGAVSASLPLFQSVIPALPFAILSVLFSAGSGLATLVKQPKLLAAIEAAKQGDSDATGN